MKRVHILGAAGNTEIAEISISGDVVMYGQDAVRWNREAAEEAARVLHNRLPGDAWDAFLAKANFLATHDPYKYL